jgi:NADH dehydrogenase/NADH:ubiquinone oxidoreductase 75 kD subunit (chain G)
MINDEMFEPYDRLISITIEGCKEMVPENNSLLRCFQFLDVEGISDAELCWNGDCLDCQVLVKIGDSTKAAIACRTIVKENMEITGLSTAINYRSETR